MSSGGGAVDGCVLYSNLGTSTIRRSGGTLLVRNSTIADNAGVATGGVENIAGGASTLQVVNSILWNNAVAQFSGAVSILYSDVTGGAVGTGNINADPKFVNPGAGIYSIKPGSPCIDAGDSGAVPATLPVDLQLESRLFDDPATVDSGVGGPPVVDMGADEFHTLILPGDLNGDGHVNGADLGLLLGSWGGPGGDLNGDGVTNGADLGILLGNWTG